MCLLLRQDVGGGTHLNQSGVSQGGRVRLIWWAKEQECNKINSLQFTKVTDAPNALQQTGRISNKAASQEVVNVALKSWAVTEECVRIKDVTYNFCFKMPNLCYVLSSCVSKRVCMKHFEEYHIRNFMELVWFIKKIVRSIEVEVD